MQTRRKTLKQSAVVAGLLATTGLFPQYAFAFNNAAFEAKSLADVLKALGAGAPVASKDVVIGGPDIAENGAVVPLTASTTLPGVKQILILFFRFGLRNFIINIANLDLILKLVMNPCSPLSHVGGSSFQNENILLRK